jgi:hypothetical protein
MEFPTERDGRNFRGDKHLRLYADFHIWFMVEFSCIAAAVK